MSHMLSSHGTITLIYIDSQRLMATYEDETLDCILPTIPPGEKEHVLVSQDESIFHTNEYRQRLWLVEDQQAIWKKGNGCAVHVSNFISETIRWIKLSEDQIAEQLTLPAKLCLPMFEAQKITYPGKGFDEWNLPQLINQLEHTIKVFDHTHLDCIVIFVFDRSSAHKGFMEDTLNVNNMNVGPGGMQRKLHNTVIPLSNPEGASGEEDMHSRVQKMCFLDNHPNPVLRGKAKGIKIVLEEHKSIWDKYMKACMERDVKPVGKCLSYSKSQIKKDAECHVIFAETVGQVDAASENDIAIAHLVTPPTLDNIWCCMQCVLSLQEDFQMERPLVQSLIKDVGHICLFLPWFHCKLNPIEMLWGYRKNCTCIFHMYGNLVMMQCFTLPFRILWLG